MDRYAYLKLTLDELEELDNAIHEYFGDIHLDGWARRICDLYEERVTPRAGTKAQSAKNPYELPISYFTDGQIVLQYKNNTSAGEGINQWGTVVSKGVNKANNISAEISTPKFGREEKDQEGSNTCKSHYWKLVAYADGSYLECLQCQTRLS